VVTDLQLRPPVATPADLRDPSLYLNRELSWLEFNRRVLHEALDHRTPLLERVKFLSIFSSNLDEFFQVRVAGLKQQVAAGIVERTADGMTPEAQIRAIAGTVREMVVSHRHCLMSDVLPPWRSTASCCIGRSAISSETTGSTWTATSTRTCFRSSRHSRSIPGTPSRTSPT